MEDLSGIVSRALAAFRAASDAASLENAKARFLGKSGELTASQLAAKHGIHQTMVGEWKRQAMEGLASVFSGTGSHPDRSMVRAHSAPEGSSDPGGDANPSALRVSTTAAATTTAPSRVPEITNRGRSDRRRAVDPATPLMHPPEVLRVFAPVLSVTARKDYPLEPTKRTRDEPRNFEE